MIRHLLHLLLVHEAAQPFLRPFLCMGMGTGLALLCSSPLWVICVVALYLLEGSEGTSVDVRSQLETIPVNLSPQHSFRSEAICSGCSWLQLVVFDSR